MRRTAGVIAMSMALLAVAGPANAMFTDSAVEVAGNDFVAGVLAPPTGVSVAWTCKGKGVERVGTLTWTPSASSFVDGYRVRIGGAVIADVLGTTVGVSGRKNEVLTYEVEAYAGGWTSTTAVTTTVC